MAIIITHQAFLGRSISFSKISRSIPLVILFYRDRTASLDLTGIEGWVDVDEIHRPVFESLEDLEIIAIIDIKLWTSRLFHAISVMK